ncbi:gluconate 2-dehydrogenase subunit 3 family protein [Paenacidovorax monticola]|uniref:Gluconate 2-dehydrogenase subunit 3 family protein n=1 Tax=Paenacidovorax monticola TaxID=1926868 RepID=A0A7H0HJ00_9BURK|nr:gluconate 2-dehydrogenase subunit 3 family protein [Paenacidovorax monticola]QNP60516.1 gluconate 2-dehydrogenase subunit 3 family protein [Paenacidovorax monticola]
MKHPKDPSAPGTMRVLDKQPTLQRRSFLRGGGLGAIGITVIPVASLAASKDVAARQSFRHLGAATGRTLVRMARDIYPHDKLADTFYVEAVAPYDAASAKDKGVKKLLADGVKDLDQRARQRCGVPYAEVKTEDERVALLKDIEATPFFKKVQGDLVTGLYNNKKLWPLFGYEGSAWEKGGYVNRGFDDIDWL